MNSEVYRALPSAHIQPNTTELIGCRVTVQLDNNPKYTEKTFQLLKTQNTNQVNHRIVTQWNSFSVPGDKINLWRMNG